MGHWYDREGNPHHTYINAKGEVKDTTLRQARPNQWLPSVTGITGVMAAPALENWKLDQLAKVMAANPFNIQAGFVMEDVANYIKEMKKLAQEGAIASRDEGSRIHAAIEAYYRGFEYPVEYTKHVEAVVDLIADKFGLRAWNTETSFAHPLGYGGTCDLWFDVCDHADPALDEYKTQIVIDIKSKDWDIDDKPPKGYPNQAMQLEACANGLKIPDASIYNIFVSRTTPGLVHLYQHNKSDYWEMFQCLLKIWQINNNYHCGFEEEPNGEVPVL